MDISKKSLETLIDLVEIKLSCIEVHDRDDKRVRDSLETCLMELRGLNDTIEPAAFAKPVRQGRPVAA